MKRNFVSVRQIIRAIYKLVRPPDESILIWSDGDVKYISIVRWQDYQNVQHPSHANCPFPVPEVFRKLSGKTQELFRKHVGRFSGNIPEGLCPDETRLDKSGGAAPKHQYGFNAYHSALTAIPGYSWDADRDVPLWDSLSDQYPGVDLAAEVGKMHTWLAAQGMLPLRGNARPRKRIANWMAKARPAASIQAAPAVAAPTPAETKDWMEREARR